MQTLFHRITAHFIFIALIVSFSSDVRAVESSFEIQVFDGAAEVVQPYALISGKQYRLQAVSLDGRVLPAQWFLSGNLGRITTGVSPMLTAVFVGQGSLICRVEGVELRTKLSVVPEKKTIGSGGGKLRSPAGVVVELPKDAFAIEREIKVEIVAPPGLPPTPHRFVRVIRISPEKLVLKRPGKLTFLFGNDGFTAAKPQLYFWEAFGRKWVPLQGDANTIQSSVTASINHFGIYTLMAAAPEDLQRGERLQIQNVKLSPRILFAPDRNRLTITYQLNARDVGQVFVTMDIFDLQGRRIRRLLEDAPRYIGPNVAQWDGLTDHSVLVRNGRYLLVIRARAGSQQSVHRKLIIVFK